MKLELKHLAPYLPYELKVQYEGILNGKQLSEYKKLEPKNEMICKSEIEEYNNWVFAYPKTIEGEKISEIKGIKFFKNYASIHVGKRFSYSKTVFCNNIKPILRPLSDLRNKELDYWIELAEVTETMTPDYLIKSLIEKYSYSMDFEKYQKVLEYFNENHFDYMSLIEQGLAIDINTLNEAK